MRQFNRIKKHLIDKPLTVIEQNNFLNIEFNNNYKLFRCVFPKNIEIKQACIVTENTIIINIKINGTSLQDPLEIIGNSLMEDINLVIQKNSLIEIIVNSSENDLDAIIGIHYVSY